MSSSSFVYLCMFSIINFLEMMVLDCFQILRRVIKDRHTLIQCHWSLPEFSVVLRVQIEIWEYLICQTILKAVDDFLWVTKLLLLISFIILISGIINVIPLFLLLLRFLMFLLLLLVFQALLII